jgi:hypothetical protein
MATAGAANTRKEFDDALKALDAALEVCPDSVVAQQLKQETSDRKAAWEKELQERRRRSAEFWEDVLQCIALPFKGVGIALFFVLWACLSVVLVVGLTPFAYVLDVIISSFKGFRDVDLALCRGVWELVKGMWDL